MSKKAANSRSVCRMSMPFFAPKDDPGPSFSGLLRSIGLTSSQLHQSGTIETPHATTCVGLRYVDGVVLAGDRRATMGGRISHRGVEKVVQADSHSGIAISGSASQSMEMIKMFQLELEHYEKMEGQSVSLEGKANMLSGMVRANLPAAMQGLVVLPMFGGYDTRERVGRLWNYDGAGGRYEEREFVSIGSGGDAAGSVIKLGWRTNLSRQDAIVLACRSLWEAADVDSGTGGPDSLRQIYPIVATITVDGWSQLDDAETAPIFEAIAEEQKTR